MTRSNYTCILFEVKVVIIIVIIIIITIIITIIIIIIIIITITIIITIIIIIIIIIIVVVVVIIDFITIICEKVNKYCLLWWFEIKLADHCSPPTKSRSGSAGTGHT